MAYALSAIEKGCMVAGCSSDSTVEQHTDNACYSSWAI